MEEIGRLARLLRDADPDVRLAAVESLEELGKTADPEETDEPGHASRRADDCAMALVTALFDDNAHIRWRAARALGALRSPEAVFPLLELLHDQNRHVAWAAVDALEAIGDPSTAQEIEKFKRSRYTTGG